MRLHTKLIIIILLYPMSVFCEECKVQFNEVQDGVNEAIFDSVRVKFEDANKLAKMKMTGQTGSEDWTSVSTADGYGQINGFEGNGDTARLLYQMIVKQEDSIFKWAMFKLEKRNAVGGTGTAYFVSGNKVACGKVSLTRWSNLVSVIFKDKLQSLAAINLERDSL